MSNPQKAYPTSEFVIVSYYRDYRVRSLVCRLSNGIRQAGRQADKKSSFSNFLKIKYYSYIQWVILVSKINYKE